MDKDYYVDPKLLLTQRIPDSTFAVLGQCKPGAFQFQGEQKLTILDGIAMAGGLTRLAKENKIEFTRAGKTKIYSMDDLKNVKDPKQLIYLEAGDIINVRETLF